MYSGHDVVVVAPWFEGGGAQRALEGILRELNRDTIHLVILFGSDDHVGELRNLVGRITVLGERKTPLGVLRAARRLRALTAGASAVYSLMRGSHLVLGLGCVRNLRRVRFAASFHMLPSDDSRSLVGRMEDLLVRRAVRVADLVTAPSRRAVTEIVDFGFADSTKVFYEANRVAGSLQRVVPPREGTLTTVRLVIACRLTAQKGLDRLPELLATATQPIDLRIFGDGELAPLIKQIVADTDKPHRVTYFGRIEDVFPEIDAADALLMPSRAELNPVLVWEAWSRGRPVIASDLPVFLDLQQQGPVTACADNHAFANAISDLAQSPGQRQRAFDLGIESFARQHSERSAIAEFLSR